METKNVFAKFKTWYLDLNFLRKIQIGFLLIAIISTMIAVNDFLQMQRLEKNKDAIFKEFLAPKEEISKIFSDFQTIQFIMLKFSIPEFADNFNSYIQTYNQHKENIDSTIAKVISTATNATIKKEMEEVKTIWDNYKNLVADGIISAAVMQNFEMASVISISSGEEVGMQLTEKFNAINASLNNLSKQINENFSADVSSSQLNIIIGMAVGSLIFLFVTFVMGPSVIKPLYKLKDITEQYSYGDFTEDINITSKDEIGNLASMLKKMRDGQLQKIEAAQMIANGNPQKVTPASDKDALSFAFNQEVETINELVAEAEKLIEANKRGDLHTRGDVTKFKGRWKEIIEGMNSILNSMVAPIDEADKILSNLAESDFTSLMSGEYSGDYDRIKNNVNKVVASMNVVLHRVMHGANEMTVSVNEINANTEEMTRDMNEQSMRTSDVAAAMEQMTRTILENTKNATSAAEAAAESGEKATLGGRVVQKQIEEMEIVAQVVNKSAATIENLGKSSAEIGEIIKVINDIADQTNLLALNAAIEAARAGEQGRGFAVVADEVRKLAERTTKATKEIEGMIKSIQTDTADAVESINEGTAEVEKGKELAQETGAALDEIIKNSEAVADLIRQLAAASEEQSTTSEEISRSVEEINNISHHNTDLIRQVNETVYNLTRMSNDFNNIVSQFKLNNALAEQSENRQITEGTSRLLD
jgi:methyl-accepting chemotaxis protein